MVDSFRYFSSPRNFCILIGLFFYILVIMLDFFVFTFLAEKFTEFAIQQVIYVIIASGLIGYVIFSVFLTRTRRRALNVGISGHVGGVGGDAGGVSGAAQGRRGRGGAGVDLCVGAL